MTHLKIISALFLAIAPSAFGINVCGLEKLKKCHPHDSCCITDNLDPALRKWFSKGRPEYFIDGGIDPLCVPTLTVKFNGYVMEMKDVVIHGLIGDSPMTKHSMDFHKKEMTKVYKLNLSISSDKYCLTDPNGKNVQHSEPFKAKLSDILAEVSIKMDVVKRCDGTRYLSMHETVDSSVKDECNVSVKSGAPPLCSEDADDFYDALIQAVRLVCIQSLVKGYTGFTTRVPMHEYFIMKDQC